MSLNLPLSPEKHNHSGNKIRCCSDLTGDPQGRHERNMFVLRGRAVGGFSIAQGECALHKALSHFV